MTTTFDAPADGAAIPPASFAEGFLGQGGASGQMGLTLVSNIDGRVRMRLVWRAELCRSNSQPALHAGAIITAIDSAMGMSGMLFMQGSSGIATLDLRYDEFSTPANNADVVIEACCERLDGDLLFITGSCYSADSVQLHGRATGRFIRTANINAEMLQKVLARAGATSAAAE